mmetsp:Transcript_81622/g.189577  ORF Transcript_81622/g.189577 Transcript_81622/m.189577 type:complete len:205 (-) Transcript_81622:1807-2421(-)
MQRPSRAPSAGLGSQLRRGVEERPRTRPSSPGRRPRGCAASTRRAWPRLSGGGPRAGTRSRQRRSTRASCASGPPPAWRRTCRTWPPSRRGRCPGRTCGTCTTRGVRCSTCSRCCTSWCRGPCHRSRGKRPRPSCPTEGRARACRSSPRSCCWCRGRARCTSDPSRSSRAHRRGSAHAGPRALRSAPRGWPRPWPLAWRPETCW